MGTGNTTDFCAASTGQKESRWLLAVGRGQFYPLCLTFGQSKRLTLTVSFRTYLRMNRIFPCICTVLHETSINILADELYPTSSQHQLYIYLLVKCRSIYLGFHFNRMYLRLSNYYYFFPRARYVFSKISIYYLFLSKLAFRYLEERI